MSAEALAAVCPGDRGRHSAECGRDGRGPCVEPPGFAPSVKAPTPWPGRPGDGDAYRSAVDSQRNQYRAGYGRGRADERAALTHLDAAMHSVWLHGKWRWLTRNMTTEEKEAAADAVDRHNATWPEADRGALVERWWRDDAPAEGGAS